MAKLHLKRVVLNGEATKIEFGCKCVKWIVKNFSEGDIYVSFEEPLNENEAIKIKSNCGQVVMINVNTRGCISDSIVIKGKGEVEVQQLCY